MILRRLRFKPQNRSRWHPSPCQTNTHSWPEPGHVLGFGITYKNLAPVTDDGYRSTRRAMLKRYDANGDELDAQERSNSKEVEAEKKVWLERYDLDGDGEISSRRKRPQSKAGNTKDKGPAARHLRKCRPALPPLRMPTTILSPMIASSAAENKAPG